MKKIQFIIIVLSFFSNNYAQEVLNPFISYSSFIGGTRSDYFYDSCYDESGNLYLVGEADTNEVIKMNATLDSIIANVNIKSYRTTTPRKVALDQNGNVYIAGTTNTWDLITTENAWDDTYANNPDRGSDVFIYKYDSDLQELLYGTYFGGFDDDYIGDIYVDKDENIYILGSTFSGMLYENVLYSSNYPRVYLAKINTITGLLEYITFLKGDGQDRGYTMAVDNNNYIYIAGSTGSDNFPTSSDAAYSNALGPHGSYGSWDADAFIAKLDMDGNLIKSTYLGGTSGYERCTDLIINRDKLIAVGFTKSNDFPILNSEIGESYQDREDIFICELDTNLTQITRSTVFGGEDDDHINSILMDFQGNYCITGFTESSAYPITDNALNSTIQGTKDLFITKIDGEFNNLIFSSYCGGTNKDEASAIKITPDYNILLIGNTYSADFPITENAYQETFASSVRNDGFVLILDDFIASPTEPVCNFSADIKNGQVPLIVQFSDSSIGPITSWLWDFGDGQTSDEQNPIHTYESSGIYTVTLTVTGPGGSDTMTKVNYIIASEPAPIAAFGADSTVGIAPFTVQFSDSSTGVITSWNWDFGDGASSSEQHPTHTYETADSFTVSLTVSGPGGADTMTKNNYVIVNLPTGLDNDLQVPTEFCLFQNYPNPFNPVTQISFALPQKSNVEISIYNLKGQLVETVYNQTAPAGVHHLSWDALDKPSGTYFIIMTAGKFQQIQKCLLLK